jgi:hypothetical protein
VKRKFHARFLGGLGRVNRLRLPGISMSIPPDQYDLYAQFGIAAEKAQTLELEAGNFVLTYLGLFFKPGKTTEEQRGFLCSLVDDMNHKTLGRVLKSIKGLATFDQSFLTGVEGALERRNYLTHHFFRRHNFAIYSEQGRKAMIEELREIQEEFDLAYAMLSAASGALQGHTGLPHVTEEQIQKLVAEGRRIEI